VKRNKHNSAQIASLMTFSPIRSGNSAEQTHERPTSASAALPLSPAFDVTLPQRGICTDVPPHLLHRKYIVFCTLQQFVLMRLSHTFGVTMACHRGSAKNMGWRPFEVRSDLFGMR
jgi:hypothetical protein